MTKSCRLTALLCCAVLAPALLCSAADALLLFVLPQKKRVVVMDLRNDYEWDAGVRQRVWGARPDGLGPKAACRDAAA
jgi:hypothetical protein